MIITYHKEQLLAEPEDFQNETGYHITWPDHSIRLLVVRTDADGNPQWQFLTGENPKQAAEIGELIEELTL